MKYYLPLLLIGFLGFSRLQAQTCTQRLNQAEDDYEAGRLLDIPNMLKNCLASGEFTKEEGIRARKLLTLVYIFTDNEGLAEASMVDLLRADPEHKLNPEVDPAELYFLYNQFRVDPIFRIGVRLGGNNSSVRVINERSLSNNLNEGDFGPWKKSYNGTTQPGDENSTPEAPKFATGFWVELTIEKYLGYGVEAIGGLQVRKSKFVTEQELNLPAFRNEITDQQFYFRLPILARYNLLYETESKIIPYISLGGSIDLLTKAYLDGRRNFGAPFTITEGDPRTDLINTGMVNRINFALTGGLGMKVRVKTHFFTVDLRYDSGRRNYIESDNAFSGSQVSVFDAAHVSDDVSLDFTSVSIGWIHSIYNPKKLKD